MRISIELEETEIYKLLDSMITHQNKSELLKLLTPILCSGHKSAELFIKCAMLGLTLPDSLPEGTIVSINIDGLNHLSSERERISNSHLNIGDNRILGVIDKFRGYHEYSSYSVNTSGLI